MSSKSRRNRSRTAIKLGGAALGSHGKLDPQTLRRIQQSGRIAPRRRNSPPIHY